MKGYVKKIIIYAAVILAFVFSFVGCKDSSDGNKKPNGGTSYSITLDKSSLTIREDETAVLTATTNSSEKIKWNSDNKAVVSVVSGRIIAKAIGTAVVTASVGNETASCGVTVIARGASGYIKTDKDSYEVSLKGGITADITAEYCEIKDNGEQIVGDKSFVFESADTSIATVDAEGVVTPVKEGKTTITVSVDGVSTSVVADVYTAAVGTPSEWIEMITSKEYTSKSDKRFYLSKDIDMGEIDYNIDEVYKDKNYFSAELNGRGMTVSDIALNRRISSVFGNVWGANVYDLTLKNVSFGVSCEHGSGLADVVTTHDLDDNLSEAIVAGRTRETSFRNVSLDLVYRGAATVGYGLARIHYGGTFENIFVEMQAETGKLKADNFKAVTGGTYYWGTKGTISGVIVYAQGLTLDITGADVYDKTNAISNNYVCKSITEAAYKAYSIYDLSKWTISPTSAPSLIKK